MENIENYKICINECNIDIEKNNKKIQKLSILIEEINKLKYEEEEFFYNKNIAYSHVQDANSKAVSSLGAMLKKSVDLSKQQDVICGYEEIVKLINKKIDSLYEENDELRHRSSYYQDEIDRIIEKEN